MRVAVNLLVVAIIQPVVGEAQCAMWCNYWTCPNPGNFFDWQPCGGCSFCEHSNHYCANWCNADTASLSACAGCADPPHPPPNPEHCLTVRDINATLTAWAGALVHIGDEWLENGCEGAKVAAQGAIDAAYAAEPLQFKPALTVAPNTFRQTHDEALSYFVGACAGEAAHISTDNGFGLGYSAGNPYDPKTWYGFKAARFHQFRYLTGGYHCQSAVAQGKLTVTSRLTGNTTTVDKTFVFTPGPTGVQGGLNARIVVHHSSKEIDAKKDDEAVDEATSAPSPSDAAYMEAAMMHRDECATGNPCDDPTHCVCLGMFNPASLIGL